MIFSLIYVSSASRLLTPEQLQALLVQFRDTNARLGITGMLLYKSGNFMQLLEGPRVEVLKLYEAIRLDPRHRDVITVDQREQAERSFPDWSRGFTDMDRIPDNSDYREYFRQALDSARFREDADFARDFILTFNRLNP